jgi:hypothetical protein
MLCHRCGSSAAGGAVMPWPVMPSRAHSPASWAGTGAARRQRAGRVQRGDDVTGPVADEGAQVGIGGGRLSGFVLREGRGGGEDPGGDDVQQELTGAVRVPRRGDIRRRRGILRVQVDAAGGLADDRGQVKPADLVRRVRAQQLARCHLTGPDDLVAEPPYW